MQPLPPVLPIFSYLALAAMSATLLAIALMAASGGGVVTLLFVGPRELWVDGVLFAGSLLMSAVGIASWLRTGRVSLDAAD